MKRLNQLTTLTFWRCMPTVFALLSACAVAASPGSMVVNGKTTTFTSAYAYHHPASYDKDVIQSTIVLSDKAIDVKKIKAAGGDFDKALHAWLDEGKVAYWEAIFYPDGEYWSGQAISPGVYAFYNRIGCKLTMTRNDAKGIEGACRTEDEKEKENHDGGLYVDIKFAAGL